MHACTSQYTNMTTTKNVLYIIRETRVSTINRLNTYIVYNIDRETHVLSNNNKNNIYKTKKNE